MNPLVLAPIVGDPPTLEWVALHRLAIDESYQRSIEGGRSKVLIAQIARSWDWRLYQPLSVSRRDGGQLFVVDGQHRLAAARARGDIPHLPVVITAFQDAREEAAAFEGMNRQRKAMGRLERYRAAFVAGDPLTVVAIDALRCAGLTLPQHENTDRWKPSNFAGIASVVNGIKRHGRKVVEAALVALGEGFTGEPLTSGSSLLNALILIYRAPPEGFDPDILIEVLGTRTQGEWVDRGRAAAAAEFGLQSAEGISQVMLAEMHKLQIRRAS